MGTVQLDDWVLCRIYKKSNNTQRSGMEHERDECMEDLIGVGVGIGIGGPSSMNARFHHQLSKMSSTVGYGGSALMAENNPDQQMSLLEGVIASNNKQVQVQVQADVELPFNSNTKRTLSSLYWNNNNIHGEEEEEDHVGGMSGSGSGSGGLGSTNKRSMGIGLDDNNNSNSIATLLNQIPQTPSLHQHAMLASYPYPIPGMNWYA